MHFHRKKEISQKSRDTAEQSQLPQHLGLKLSAHQELKTGKGKGHTKRLNRSSRSTHFKQRTEISYLRFSLQCASVIGLDLTWKKRNLLKNACNRVSHCVILKIKLLPQFTPTEHPEDHSLAKLLGKKKDDNTSIISSNKNQPNNKHTQTPLNPHILFCPFPIGCQP